MMMNDDKKLEGFLKLGDTILDSYVAATFFDTKKRENPDADFLLSTMKILEAIVLHEKMYSRFLNSDAFDSSQYAELHDILCPFPIIVFHKKERVAYLYDKMGNTSFSIQSDFIGTKFASRREMLFYGKIGVSFTTTDIVYNPQSNYQKYQQKSLDLTAKESQKQMLENDEWIVGNFFQLDAPLIFNYIVYNSSSFDDMILNALDLRASKEAEYFREMSKAFENAVKTNDSDNAVFIIDEMKNAILQLSRKTSKPPLIPIDVSFPLGFSINIGEILSHLQFPPRHHISFISRLYNSAIRSTGTIDKFMGFLK